MPLLALLRIAAVTLVVAAFLDTACDGDPANASAQQKSRVKAALTASDMDAVIALRNDIPGSPGHSSGRKRYAMAMASATVAAISPAKTRNSPIRVSSRVLNTPL